MNSIENNECIVCERPLSDDVFMRIKIEEEYVKVCCPLCAKRFNQHESFYLTKRKASQLLIELQERRRNRKA